MQNFQYIQYFQLKQNALYAVSEAEKPTQLSMSLEMSRPKWIVVFNITPHESITQVDTLVSNGT